MSASPRLDAAQSAAVSHGDGPCAVLAGPGAGKTAVLTARAAALVRSGVPAERVLLMTFTRASAREMLDRAKRMEPECERLSGGTFHSVAMRIINRNAHVFDVEKFTVLDPDDCRQVFKKVMEPMRGGAENWPTAAVVSKVVGLSVNTQSTIEQCVAKLCPRYASFVPVFEEVRDAYVSYKLERSLIDYDDCLEYLATLLEDDEIGPLVRDQWDHCMFDEYQDTNALQLRIVYGLASDRRNVMVVGDAAQSIYGFRGSAPHTMPAFLARFPDASLIKLETNYRSSSEIVSMVNAADRITGSGFQRTLVSASGSSGIKPILMESPDETVQAAEIAKAVLAHKADGGDIADCAVIVRSMSAARRVEVEFTTRRIPYKVTGGLRIDEAAHVKDLLSVARVATNHRHEPAWIRILERHRRIGDVAATEIADRISLLSDPGLAPEVLEKEAAARSTSFEGLPDALRGLLQPARRPFSSLSDAVALMEPFWSQLKDWRDDWEDRRRDIDAVLHIADEHRDLDSFLTAITLDYSVDRKRDEDDAEDQERPVTISTVHGAKGLEWPIVHVPSFVRGHMPAPYADDLEEEARILYVAISRARRGLTLHKPLFDSRGGYTSPSDYERLIRPLCEVRRAHAAPVGGATIATTKRIDMRAKLLKRP